MNMVQAESFIDNLIQQLENISVILDIPIIPPDIPEDITSTLDEDIPSKDVSPNELLSDIVNIPWWWNGSQIVELNDETSL